MIVKVLFLSAAAFVAYKYIGKSNAKAKELREAKRGTVEILPPSSPPAPAAGATEQLRQSRTTALISPAAEDLSRRY